LLCTNLSLLAELHFCYTPKLILFTYSLKVLEWKLNLPGNGWREGLRKAVKEKRPA
jgi:hypothetical protein